MEACLQTLARASLVFYLFVDLLFSCVDAERHVFGRPLLE